jgi:hypothetical protein
LYLLQMLDTGRWILDKPVSRIRNHMSSIQDQASSIKSFLVPACPG